MWNNLGIVVTESSNNRIGGDAPDQRRSAASPATSSSANLMVYPRRSHPAAPTLQPDDVDLTRPVGVV